MNNGTHSEALWRKIRLAEGRLWSASEQFWSHTELPGLLPRFFVQLHGIMHASVPLMVSVRDRALRFKNDETAEITARYLEAHIQEEEQHEEWLLQDLGEIGFNREEVLRNVPGAGVATLVGAQYFWSSQYHPVAIFGYLAVLEGYPPLTSQLKEIQSRAGFPAKAFRCLIAHAEDDPEHLADINRTLDKMSLTLEQSKLIALSAFHTIDAVAAIFEQLIATGSHREWRATHA
jgi:pyrroloquinoline quinone (PQQ) biosynthesis protein C